jgi:hypothetical protein
VWSVLPTAHDAVQDGTTFDAPRLTPVAARWLQDQVPELEDLTGHPVRWRTTAFERVTGMPMLRQAKIDGITEGVIFRETAKLHGIETDVGDFERFAGALAAAHVERAADLRERGHALPGAATALDAGRDPGCPQRVAPLMPIPPTCGRSSASGEPSAPEAVRGIFESIR